MAQGIGGTPKKEPSPCHSVVWQKLTLYTKVIKRGAIVLAVALFEEVVRGKNVARLPVTLRPPLHTPYTIRHVLPHYQCYFWPHWLGPPGPVHNFGFLGAGGEYAGGERLCSPHRGGGGGLIGPKFKGAMAYDWPWRKWGYGSMMSILDSARCGYRTKQHVLHHGLAAWVGYP